MTFVARKVSRMTKDRYVINLPVGLNELWDTLHRSETKVVVTVKPIPINPNPISRYGVETPRATPRVLDRGASPASPLGGQEAGRIEDKG